MFAFQDFPSPPTCLDLPSPGSNSLWIRISRRRWDQLNAGTMKFESAIKFCKFPEWYRGSLCRQTKRFYRFCVLLKFESIVPQLPIACRSGFPIAADLPRLA